ncbi:MAG: hypothetical protein R3330_17730, partial [Saprospiraceae bacterium]|nr:hypothetical protein [Saprospiraceae bacterium]
DPSCGQVTLTATLDGNTNLWAITPNTGNQVGVVNQNTGAVAFSSVNIGFDPTAYTVTENTLETSTLDIQIQAGAASCVIDVIFTENFYCDPVNCLLHGSQIAMADGRYRRIEYLTVGDLVRSMVSPRTGLDFSVVTQVNTHHLRAAYFCINGALRITDDHPVLVRRDERWSWLRVDALVVGDVIKSDNGGVLVEWIEKHNTPALTVYVETSSGDLVTRAGDRSYVVKSTYAAGVQQFDTEQAIVI